MAYIGHSPTNAGTFYILDDITIGSGTTYGLAVGGVSVSPSADNLLITLDGVIQHPGDAYTVSGSNIVFASGPGSGVEFYGIIMGQSASTGQGSIGADELKVSGDGSSGQVLVSDGDGTFSWATDTEAYVPLAGGTMTGTLAMGSNNITGTGDIGGTLTTAAQTAITSVGTLTSFRSTGIDDNADALAVTIDSSENIGIGVTNPSSFDDEAEKLVVGTGSGNQGMTIYAGTSSRAKIHFADGASGTSAYRGMVSYDHNGDSMSFATSNTTALTLDSSQNATFAGNITIPAGNAIYLDGGGNSKVEEFATDKVNIQAGGENLVLLGNGSSAFVGVGTTTPSQAITIKHPEPTILFIHEHSSDEEIGFIGDCANFLTGSSPSATSFGVRSTGDFRIGTGGNNLRMTIASGGNATFLGAVGIGADPSYKFDTQENSTGWAGRFLNTNAGGQGLLVRTDATNGATALGVYANGAYRLTLTESLVTFAPPVKFEAEYGDVYRKTRSKRTNGTGTTVTQDFNLTVSGISAWSGGMLKVRSCGSAANLATVGYVTNEYRFAQYSGDSFSITAIGDQSNEDNMAVSFPTNSGNNLVIRITWTKDLSGTQGYMASDVDVLFYGGFGSLT